MARQLRSLVVAVLALIVCVGMSSAAQAVLTGYWQFSSTDPAGIAIDSAGGDHNGTFQGSQITQFVDGTRGDVISLNPGEPASGGGYVAVPNMGAYTNTTWSAWVNLRSATSGTAGGYPMFMTGSPATGYEFRFLGTTQRPEIINSSNIAQSPNALALNTWHQITHTSAFNGTNNSFVLYVDGVSVASGTGTGWAGGIVNFGRRVNDTYFFNGLLDEVQIWNNALNAGKAKAIYNPVLGYDATKLDSLFTIYDNMGGQQTIDGRNWNYITGLTGHNAGDNWIENNIAYLQLDALGNGVTGMFPVPEPNTGLMLLLGGVALRLRRRARIAG